MPSAPDPGKPAEWRSEAGIVWVYVLRSAVRGTLYIGQTNDLQGRIRQHNNPAQSRSLFTKRHAGPWRLVHAESLPSRAAAMARERYLKSGRGREWLQGLLNGGASPPPAD